MNARILPRHSLYGLLAGILLLLSACQEAALASGSRATLPAQPTRLPATPVSSTAPVIPATQSSSGGLAGLSLEYAGVAQNVSVESVAARPAGGDTMWTEVMPQYRRVNLEGYAISNHPVKAQIFVYPVGELASANGSAGKTAADLQLLLKTQQAGEQLPYLPLAFSSRQAIDVQVQYLDFKNGNGVRFLTQFNNGMAPINNSSLIYTFQGLTSDGKYYISVVLPVTHSKLPNSTTFSEQEAKAGQDYLDYLSQTVTLLNAQPAENFTPDLNKLDALVRSIEVQ
jgi:hypothetical protein